MTKNWFKPSSNKPSHELVMRHIYLSVYNGMHSIIPLGFVYLLLYRKCLFTYIYHLSPKKNSRKCFVTRTFQTYLGTKEWKDIWRRHGMKNKEEERQKKKQKKRKMKARGICRVPLIIYKFPYFIYLPPTNE